MRPLPGGARWREVPHGADRALWVRAGGVPELVAGCVLALSDFTWGIGTLRPGETVTLDLGDPGDPEGMIFRALSEALFLAEVPGLLPAEAFAEVRVVQRAGLARPVARIRPLGVAKG